MGKLTISMAIFNSYVSLPEGTPPNFPHLPLKASRNRTEALIVVLGVYLWCSAIGPAAQRAVTFCVRSVVGSNVTGQGKIVELIMVYHDFYGI